MVYIIAYLVLSLVLIWAILSFNSTLYKQLFGFERSVGSTTFSKITLAPTQVITLTTLVNKQTLKNAKKYNFVHFFRAISSREVKPASHINLNFVHFFRAISSRGVKPASPINLNFRFILNANTRYSIKSFFFFLIFI